VSNTTLSGNSALTNGGAVQVISGTLSAVHATLASNISLSGTGGLAHSGGVTLLNTLVANNLGGNCQAAVVDAGGNLQWPGTACGAMPTADPLLGPLADNGGGTLTHALAPGSPAVNAALSGGCPAADQRGVPRNLGACDIGAYELVLNLFLPLVIR
jgi:hypothetical protein